MISLVFNFLHNVVPCFQSKHSIENAAQVKDQDENLNFFFRAAAAKHKKNTNIIVLKILILVVLQDFKNNLLDGKT